MGKLSVQHPPGLLQHPLVRKPQPFARRLPLLPVPQQTADQPDQLQMVPAFQHGGKLLLSGALVLDPDRPRFRRPGYQRPGFILCHQGADLILPVHGAVVGGTGVLQGGQQIVGLFAAADGFLFQIGDPANP